MRDSACKWILIILILFSYVQVDSSESSQKAFLSEETYEWTGTDHEYFISWDTDLALWGAYSFVLEVKASGDHTTSEGYKIELQCDNVTLQQVTVSRAYQINRKFTYQVSFYIPSDEPLKTNSFVVHLTWDASFSFYQGILTIYGTSYLERYDAPAIYNSLEIPLSTFAFAPLSGLQPKTLETSTIFEVPYTPSEIFDNYRLNLTLGFSLEPLNSDEASKISTLICSSDTVENYENYNLILGQKEIYDIREGNYEFTWTIFPENSLYLVNFQFEALGIGDWLVSDIQLTLNSYTLSQEDPKEPESSLEFSFSHLIISISFIFLLPLIRFIQIRRRYLKSRDLKGFQVIRINPRRDNA